MKAELLIFAYKDEIYLDRFYLPFSENEYKLDRNGNVFYLNTRNVEGEGMGNFCRNNRETVFYNFAQIPYIDFFISFDIDTFKYLYSIVHKEWIGLLTEFIPELNIQFEKRTFLNDNYVFTYLSLIQLKTYFDFSKT